MTKNKLTFSLVLILVLAIAAFVLWFMASSKRAPANQGTSSQETTADSYFPSSADSSQETTSDGLTNTQSNPEDLALTKITEESAAAFWIDATDATIYTINAAGVISATPFGGSSEVSYGGDGRSLISAEPSTRGDSAIITTGDKNAPIIAIVNAVTGSAAFLPATATSATWHPNGKDVIFFRGADSKNPEGVYVFSAAKKSSTLIAELSLRDVFLSPYDATSLLVMQRPSGNTESTAFKLNVKTGSLSFLEKGTSLMASSYDSGSKFITYKKEGGLTLKSASLPSVQNMPLTIPNKCASSRKKIYCGVPTNRLSHFPMSYLEKAEYSIDKLVSIDNKGKVEDVWSSEGTTSGIDIYKPVFSGDSLYFINRYDSRVYSIAKISE